MPSKIALRPHHLLCLRFFDGHGYNERFTENVSSIVDKIRADDSILIEFAAGCDAVCEPCPYRIGEACKFARNVAAKDESVARFLGLSSMGEMPARDLMALVEGRIAELADVAEVCGECEWSGVCNDQLRRSRRR